MRILIITAFFPPFNIIASLRCYSWAKHWTLAGHEVTVLTTKKEQDKSIQLNSENVGFKIIEVDYNRFFQCMRKFYRRFLHNSQNQFSVATDKTTITQKRNYISKIINYLREEKGIFLGSRMPEITTDLWIRPAIYRIKKEGKWDFIISSSGPYTTHIVAKRLKKMGLTNKWIADFRDLWVDSHDFPGLFPFTLIEKKLEKAMMKEIDIITTVSKPLLETLHLKYPENEIHVIENGFDLDDLEKISTKNIFPTDGKIRIGYTGIIHPNAQDPSPLFQALSELNNDKKFQTVSQNIEVVFAGSPSKYLKYLESLISHYQLENQIKLYGFICHENALRIQRDAHALLFLEWNDPFCTGVYTGKLFEYLFSQTPIMSIGLSKNKVASQLIKEAKAGIIFDNDVNKIKNYIIDHFCANQKKIQQKASKDIISRFERKALAEKILRLVSPKNE